MCAGRGVMDPVSYVVGLGGLRRHNRLTATRKLFEEVVSVSIIRQAYIDQQYKYIRVPTPQIFWVYYIRPVDVAAQVAEGIHVTGNGAN